MENPLKVLEVNELGKDYIIGDLHGSYSIFENLLRNLNFNPAIDRMISVGDLVDRGPDSLKCLALIREPWFHSVLSNHEQMMLEKFNSGWMGQYWFRNGGEWGRDAWTDYYETHKHPELERAINPKSLELFNLLPLVEELPFLITIKTKPGKKFHVIHAELPTGVDEITDEMLSDGNQVYDLATIQRGDGDAFLWYRNIFDPFCLRDLSNINKLSRIGANQNYIFNDKLSHIISGHTILHKPMTLHSQTNIDTGAYCSYLDPEKWPALTCIELDTWTFYQATETKFSKVIPIII